METDRTASNKQPAETKKELQSQAAQEKMAATQLASVVQRQIMQAIGEPLNFLQLKVRPLWKHHFRANLYVGLDRSEARISSSFFIVTDEDGIIVSAAPSLPSVDRAAQEGARGAFPSMLN